MSTPSFDERGWDTRTFAPVALVDCRNTPWPDVRLQFFDWAWIRATHGGDTVDGYYLNGPGVQGLVMACRHDARLDVFAPGIDYNSEGDCCLVHFRTLEDAVETARLVQAMLTSPTQLRAAIETARTHGYED